MRLDEDDNRPAMITSDQHRRLLKMLEDYERRQWLWGFIGRVSKWITGVAAAIAVAQFYLGKIFK